MPLDGQKLSRASPFQSTCILAVEIHCIVTSIKSRGRPLS
jgi:hypothetical protein